MGRRLKNKNNVDNSDANYPLGRIKDNTGINDGTPVDEDVYGDVHQTFEQMANEAQTSEGDGYANEEPDNSFNGYQFFNFLRKTQDFAEIYKNGIFREVGSNIGGVDSCRDCFVWQNEIYQVDYGNNKVDVFNIFTPTTTRVIGSGNLTNPTQCQVIPHATDEDSYLLYVLSTGDNEIRVWNIDGTRVAALDITGAPLTTPFAFQIDEPNDRIYILDTGTNRVEVFALSTQANIPGESFACATNGQDLFLAKSDDRIYIARNNADVYAYQVDGTAQAGENLTGVTNLDKIHVVGKKLYILTSSSDAVLVYDLSAKSTPVALTQEGIAHSLIGNANNIFIRNGYLWVCDSDTNDTFPIKAVNVQEHL